MDLELSRDELLFEVHKLPTGNTELDKNVRCLGMLPFVCTDVFFVLVVAWCMFDYCLWHVALFLMTFPLNLP